MKINIGDLVKLKDNSFFHKRGDRFMGKVTKIRHGTDPVNHGTIEIELTEVQSYYLPVGEKEHFSYYDWQEHLEIIN